MNYLQESAWWISITLAILGIVASVYAAEVKAGLGKILLTLRNPTVIIIILLVAILLILLYK